MGHHNTEVDMNERFEFPSKLKNIAFGLMGVGLLAFLAGVFISHDSTRTLAVMLQNGLFFMLITLISTFFIAMHYMANGGYMVVFKRIPEAISQTVPLIAIFVFALVAYIIFGKLRYCGDARSMSGKFRNEIAQVFANKPGQVIRMVFEVDIVDHQNRGNVG